MRLRGQTLKIHVEATALNESSSNFRRNDEDALVSRSVIFYWIAVAVVVAFEEGEMSATSI